MHRAAAAAATAAVEEAQRAEEAAAQAEAEAEAEEMLHHSEQEALEARKRIDRGDHETDEGEEREEEARRQKKQKQLREFLEKQRLQRQKQAEDAAAILLAQAKKATGRGGGVSESLERADEGEWEHGQHDAVAPGHGDGASETSSGEDTGSSLQGGDGDGDGDGASEEQSPQASPPKLGQLSSQSQSQQQQQQQVPASSPQSSPQQPHKSLFGKLREWATVATGDVSTTAAAAEVEAVDGGRDEAPEPEPKVGALPAGEEGQQAEEIAAAAAAAAAAPAPATAAVAATTEPAAVDDRQPLQEGVAWQPPSISPQVPPPLLHQLSQRGERETQKELAGSASDVAVAPPAQQQQQPPPAPVVDQPERPSPQGSPPQLQQLLDSSGPAAKPQQEQQQQQPQQQLRLELPEEKQEQHAVRPRRTRTRLLPSPRELARRRAASLRQSADQALQASQQRLLLQLPRPQPSQEEDGAAAAVASRTGDATAAAAEDKTPQSKESLQAHAQLRGEQQGQQLPPSNLEDEMQEAEPKQQQSTSVTQATVGPVSSKVAEGPTAAVEGSIPASAKGEARQSAAAAADAAKAALAATAAASAAAAAAAAAAGKNATAAAADNPEDSKEPEVEEAKGEGEGQAIVGVSSLTSTPPWAVGEAEAAEIARAATADALSANAVAAYTPPAADASSAGPSSAQEGGPLASVSEQASVRDWLKGGVTVKKWTAGGGGTRKRKLRLEKADAGGLFLTDGSARNGAFSSNASSGNVSSIGPPEDRPGGKADAGGGLFSKDGSARGGAFSANASSANVSFLGPPDGLPKEGAVAGGRLGGGDGAAGPAGEGSVGAVVPEEMSWAACAREDVMKNGGGGGSGPGGGHLWSGEDDDLALVLQSDKGKDTSHRLSSLQEVTEDPSDKSVTLRFQSAAGEADSKMKLSFPKDRPVVPFFRQVK